MVDSEPGLVDDVVQEPGYQPPLPVQDDNPEAARRIGSWATTSVVLGACAIFVCALLAPIALSYANRADDMIADTGSGAQYATQVRVGRILAYVAIGLWLFGIVAWGALVALALSQSGVH